VALSEIISCEADGNYSTFKLHCGKAITACVSIINFEKMLSNYGFARVHKSYLINLHHIDSFRKSEMLLRMTDNSIIPVSRRRKSDLLELINKIHL
jgi:two-component system LytT family response regulator